MENRLRGFINNEHDRNNLLFLLGASPDVFLDWALQADEDDIAYARELLDAYVLEASYEYEESEIELKLMSLEEFSEAKEILNKFTKS
jgi:hypothetical protein